MFNRTAAMLAATILAGTTTIAGAQSPSTGSAGTGQPGVNVSAQADTSASRFEQRSALRRQLRSEGFQDIRISDAMFAVQARTPDGRSVLMIANPTGEQVSDGSQSGAQAGTRDRLSRNESAGSDQRGARRMASARDDQQRGQAGNQQPRTSRDVASLREGARASAGEQSDQTRAVPVRLPDGRTVLVLVTPADDGTSSQETGSQASGATQDRQASASRQGASGQGDSSRSDSRPGTNYQAYNWDHPHDEQRLNRPSDSASGDGSDSRDVARSARNAGGTADDATAVESAVREQYTGAISSELMSADRARSRLESQGFSNVGNWQKEGDTYTGTADRYGEEVDFRFDARRGEVVEPSTLGRGQVENLLSEAGFSNVEGVQQLGNTFRANAEQDGMRYLVRIDAETGEILNRRPIREG